MTSPKKQFWNTLIAAAVSISSWVVAIYSSLTGLLHSNLHVGSWPSTDANSSEQISRLKQSKSGIQGPLVIACQTYMLFRIFFKFATNFQLVFSSLRPAFSWPERRECRAAQPWDERWGSPWTRLVPVARLCSRSLHLMACVTQTLYGDGIVAPKQCWQFMCSAKEWCKFCSRIIRFQAQMGAY